MHYYKIYLLLFVSFIANICHAKGEPADTTMMKFDLGEVVISSQCLPKIKKVDAAVIERNEKQNVSDALNMVPGVIGVAGAKEHMVYVRGFNQRQIPIYLDGVPISLPYDGFLDLDMLLSTNISEISVVSGTESILYGPNALGGAINIVSSKPQNGFSGLAKLGTITNGKHNSKATLSYANNKFYTTATLAILDRNDYRLSSDYEPSSDLQGKGDLHNSYKKNTQFNMKVAYLPNANNEYALSYVINTGEKGIPPYLGEYGSPRFWQFPDYTTQSLYMIAKNKLGTNLSLKSRLYYTKFDDCLDSFDDDTYQTQFARYTFTSYYDDYSIGGISTLSYIKGQNSLNFDVQYKYDNHSEFNEGDDPTYITDQSLSLSLADCYYWDKFSIHGGLSTQFQDGLKAEYLNGEGGINEHPTHSVLVYNGEINMKYMFSSNNEISGGISYKTRFPTMKDRYSLRMGKSIANPELLEENALNYNLNYSFLLQNKFQCTAGLFYSDLKDAITPVYGILEEDTQIFQYQNAAKAEYLGGDIALSYPIFKKLMAQANYSYVKRNNISEPDVKFVDVPEHSGMISLIYQIKQSSYVNLNFESYSDRYAFSNGVKVGGYSLLNAKAAYAFFKNTLVVEAGVNNIFDKNYEVTEGYPMMGRNAFASLIYKL
ncbi:TonB-dependent receptor plug domain-containing protein [Saccharicrinis aurantiacus]|uniref:TonB-dependent receptor plug domain-containing protein n=1 Tax=Saccharicrinis aurantiacus TaxID=1849719 RepID=UPI00248FFDED|nr:TonB-dependent receptor [Saccharicrinis aurantiacus]